VIIKILQPFKVVGAELTSVWALFRMHWQMRPDSKSRNRRVITKRAKMQLVLFVGFEVDVPSSPRAKEFETVWENAAEWSLASVNTLVS